MTSFPRFPTPMKTIDKSSLGLWAKMLEGRIIGAAQVPASTPRNVRRDCFSFSDMFFLLVKTDSKEGSNVLS